MPNRLARETSPYLLQHANNPVDWYPWGDEAWARARAEDKPVLVSVGYAACHWCHVMERESFENEAIAAIQNDLVVSIKVDREERPDVDEIYMDAQQMLHGHGGWPLNVFCTPDGRPFFGGTYFPPQRRTGMPGWTDVLQGITRAFREQRDQVEQQATQLTNHLNLRVELAGEELTESPAQIRSRAATALLQSADRTHGGFGGAPKFPSPSTCNSWSSRRSTSRRATATTPDVTSPTRCARWPRAASTTSSPADSIATRSTRSGSSRTSRRCSTTTPC